MSRIFSHRSRRLVSLVWITALMFVPAACMQPLTVERVVDGDTFELSDRRTVRLIGIDTPEKHMSDKLRRDARRTGRDIETIRALGRQASQYAEQLVEGKPVELEFDPANAAQDHQDRYGRTLAYVWILGPDGDRKFRVNDRLIRKGYAYAYTRYPFEYRDKYLELQREARRNDRGLWDSGLMLEEEELGKLQDRRGRILTARLKRRRAGACRSKRSTGNFES